MKGQAKVLIPTLIGIVVLLAGISGFDLPRAGQAMAIAETRAVPMSKNALELDEAFRMEANAAARELGISIAADLAVDLKHQPTIKVASATGVKHDRG